MPLFYLYWHKFPRHVTSRLWHGLWRKHACTNQNSQMLEQKLINYKFLVLLETELVHFHCQKSFWQGIQCLLMFLSLPLQSQGLSILMIILKARWLVLRGSGVNIKSLCWITYVCQNFGIHDILHQIRKAYIRHYTFYLVVFLITFHFSYLNRMKDC